MKLLLNRVNADPLRTHGKLFIDGVYFCDTLEDTDRLLDSNDALEELNKKKIYGKTAIPIGSYTVVISYSPRFKRELPLLLNVPAYLGIRIHPGNTEVDTHGCILVGIRRGDKIINSRAMFDKLLSRMYKAMKTEPIQIEIKHDY